MLTPLTEDLHNACSQGRMDVFDEHLAEALRRLAKIRAFPRGSAEEAAAIARFTGDASPEQWEGMSDDYLDARTRQIFIAAHDPNQRYPGVFKHPEAFARRRAIELVGRYSEIHHDDGFLPGGKWSTFGEGVAACLEDEVPEVRVAAAGALFKFGGEEVPDLEGSQLVAAARERWSRHASGSTAH